MTESWPYFRQTRKKAEWKLPINHKLFFTILTYRLAIYGGPPDEMYRQTCAPNNFSIFSGFPSFIALSFHLQKQPIFEQCPVRTQISLHTSTGCFASSLGKPIQRHIFPCHFPYDQNNLSSIFHHNQSNILLHFQ